MGHSSTIEAVIWDLGGVIVRTHDHSGRARWEKRLGLRSGQLQKIVFRCETAAQAYVGRAQVDDVWRAVIDQLGVPESERLSIELDFWSGDRVDYKLVEYIRNLRPLRKTGLISNAWNDMRSSLEDQWKIADAFDHITISSEVGVAKPHPRVFNLTLEELGIDPPQAVFIDDFVINILAAQNVGLCTIQFRNPQQTIAELEELLSGPN